MVSTPPLLSLSPYILSSNLQYFVFSKFFACSLQRLYIKDIWHCNDHFWFVILCNCSMYSTMDKWTMRGLKNLFTLLENKGLSWILVAERRYALLEDSNIVGLFYIHRKALNFTITCNLVVGSVFFIFNHDIVWEQS